MFAGILISNNFSHLVSAPLLDSGHLSLRDCVVTRVEPFAQFLQDGQGGGHGGVATVDQLGAAVGGGDDLPVLDDGAAPSAGPVPPRWPQHGTGAVRPGTPESGAEGPALGRILAPRTAALEVLRGGKVLLPDGRGPPRLSVAAQYLSPRVDRPGGHHYQASVTLGIIGISILIILINILIIIALP